MPPLVSRPARRIGRDPSDRETVRRFHSVAVANGGSDEGGPGIRDDYNANYYGAFMRDLDGNKIEAVTYTARESFGL